MPKQTFYDFAGNVIDSRTGGVGTYFSGIWSAIWGRGNSKFKPSLSYFPVNQKTSLFEVSQYALMDIARNVPHLNIIISRGAEIFSLMQVKHIDKDGNDIKNSPVLKFLKKPNPLQTLSQYLYEFYVSNSVYSKTIQYKIKGLSFEKLPKVLRLLPPGSMKMNLTGKFYRTATLNDIIENFEMIEDNSIFETENIIYMAEGIGKTCLDPVSRIQSNQIPISNIVASLKSRNIIITERGMIGMVAPKASKDGDGMLPFNPDEHEKVREQYQRTYSLNSNGGHIAFPMNSYEWIPMTIDVGALKLLEGTEEDFGMLLNAWGIDRDIFSSVKGATFENKQAGMKYTIQNGMQPLADKLMEQWTEEFLNPDSGEKLIASYDHHPAMKEDERIAAQGRLYDTQRVDIMLRNNMISHEQAAELCDVKFDGSGESPAPQPAFGTVQNNKP